MTLETITLQDKLKEIIKSDIGKTMKDAGFKKKGNWFSKKDENNSKHMNVQLHSCNTKENIDFTLDLYVMENGKKPRYDEEIARGRVENLKNAKSWYSLNEEVNYKELGKTIQQDISSYVLPYFGKYS